MKQELINSICEIIKTIDNEKTLCLLYNYIKEIKKALG